MKTPPAIPRGVYTHLCSLGAGLGLGVCVWYATGASDEAAKTEATAARRSAATRASDRSQDRAGNRAGSELLRTAAPEFFENGGVKFSRIINQRDYVRDSIDRVTKAADALPPADDVAAAAVAAMALYQRQMTDGKSLSQEELREMGNIEARMLHWAREDPLAAMKHLSSPSSDSYTGQAAMFAAMKEKGSGPALECMKQTPPPNSAFRQSLASFVGTEGDIQQLENLRQIIAPGQWNNFKGSISRSWPLDKADELVSYAVSSNSPDMLASLAQSNGREGADWLMARLASGDLDPAFAAAIKATGQYRNLLLNNAHLPFDERVEAMAASNPGKDTETLGLMLGGNDVTRALNEGGKDWRFAFRNGKATFEEICDAVSASLPELAKASDDAIRLQLLKELAEESGAGAMQALASTPEPDRWTLALKPTQWNFYNVNPQEFYDYLQRIPNNDPALHQARLESWVWHSKSNLDLYSRDYVDWVKALPEGTDREMAAIGILRTIGNNAPLRAEVDTLVVDPALRARIEAPPQQ